MIVYNIENRDKAINLGGTYCDIDNNVISSVTLKPYNSKILLKCFCNDDGTCNNKETSSTCEADCISTASLKLTQEKTLLERIVEWASNLFRFLK